jgi:prepilin-type N-terminal cleavage/methylation domain-containing protein
MNTHIEEVAPAAKKDKGFTLVELLIVIVILGILSTVTVFAVRGITNRGQSTSCGADKKVLQAAAEAYFAQTGATQIATAAYATASGTTARTSQATAIAAPTGITQGASPMATLVSSKFLNSASQYHFITPDGAVLKNGTLAADTTTTAHVCGGTVGSAA